MDALRDTATQSTAASESGYGIAVDLRDGSVVVTGMFDGSVNFGGGPIAPGSGQNLFLVKLASADGSNLWSRTLKSSANTVGNAVAVDASGGIFMIGSVMTFNGLNSTIDFGAGAVTPVGNEMFLAKYTSTGGYVWARHFGTSVSGSALALDPAGNVVVTGKYQNSVNFGGTTLTNAPSSLFLVPANIYVAKFSGASGAYVWSKGYGGVRDDGGVGIAVGPSGNITVTGYVNSSVDFGGGVLNPAVLGSYAFVANLATDGCHRWSRIYGAGFTSGGAVAIGPDGDSHIVGSFRNTVDFGGAPITPPLVPAGRTDMFLLELGP